MDQGEKMSQNNGNSYVGLRYSPDLGGLIEIGSDLQATYEFLQEFPTFEINSDLERKYGAFGRYAKGLASRVVDLDMPSVEEFAQTIGFGVKLLQALDNSFRKFIAGAPKFLGLRLDPARVEPSIWTDEVAMKAEETMVRLKTAIEFLGDSRDIGEEELEEVKIAYSELSILANTLFKKAKTLQGERREAEVVAYQKTKEEARKKEAQSLAKKAVKLFDRIIRV